MKPNKTKADTCLEQLQQYLEPTSSKQKPKQQKPFCLHCGKRQQSCDVCITADFGAVDEQSLIDIELLVNPSGRTAAVFYNDSFDPTNDL